MAFRVIQLDGAFQPVGELPRIRSIDISRDVTGDAPLIESASIEFDSESPVFAGGWYRIDWHGFGVRSLGVFYFEAKDRELDKGVWTIKADGSSVLAIPNSVQMVNGDYVLAGSDGPSAVRELLRGIPSGVNVTGAQAVPQTLVFDSKDTRLSAAWKILDSIGWCIQLDGDGGVNLLPYPTEAAVEINAGSAGGVLPGISESEGKVTYEREYNQARPFDLARIDLPRNGISGALRILAQDLSIGKGVTVKERIGVLER